MPGPVESISRAVRNGTRTARDVVDEYLDVADARNPELNAFTEIDRDGALRKAARVDKGARTGLLAGVPIALKDLIDHAGQVNTAGSAFYRHRPNVSATVVDRLEAAGAIIMGRTGLHEFAFGFSSENPWFGPVRNPWDPDLSPGGSSGGSAVAVAAGMSPAAIGTDTGGSVRVPAALCGIVGLKVTHGRIPLTGVFPLAGSLDTVGPLTVTTGDARLLYEAMKGFDRSDPWSVPVVEESRRIPSVGDLLVAVPARWLERVETSGVTRRRFDGFCERLRELGATVEPVTDPALAPDPILFNLVGTEAAAVHREWFTDPTKPYGADLRDRLGQAMENSAADYLEAVRWRAGMIQAARELFAGYDLLLIPAVGHARKRIGVDTIDIDGTPTFYRLPLSGYTALVNVLGCPAISLPVLDEGIPPPAVQLVGPWWSEDLLLGVAEALERSGIVASTPPAERTDPNGIPESRQAGVESG